ncbi:MAG: hypothetical protein JWP81_977 [Ferruginibacter sp.]|nr:hypothetical protein [Ferruginibacter sp.]
MGAHLSASYLLFSTFLYRILFTFFKVAKGLVSTGMFSKYRSYTPP